jgi:hypothetical protein
MIQIFAAIISSLAAMLALIVVFVPASLELRKPADNGPRIIDGFFEEKKTAISIMNIEEETGFICLLDPIVSRVLGELPFLGD